MTANEELELSGSAFRTKAEAMARATGGGEGEPLAPAWIGNAIASVLSGSPRRLATHAGRCNLGPLAALQVYMDWLGFAAEQGSRDLSLKLAAAILLTRSTGTEEIADVRRLLKRLPCPAPGMIADPENLAAESHGSVRDGLHRLRRARQRDRPEPAIAFGPKLAKTILTHHKASVTGCRALIVVVRQLQWAASRAGDAGALRHLADSLLQTPSVSAAECWVAAMAALGEDRKFKALAFLDVAERCEPSIFADALSLKGERALVHAEYYELRPAAQALRHAQTQGSAHVAQYLRKLGWIDRVLREEPATRSYPQELLARLLSSGTAGRTLYEPEVGAYCAVSATLAAGGGERQAVNSLLALEKHSAPRRLTLLARSLSGRDGFYLPLLQASSATLIPYAESDDADPAPLAESLGEGVAGLVDLLPGKFSREVRALLPHIIAQRPSVFHIRGDLPAVLLAGMLAGVPRIVVHRGSLARNNWGYSLREKIRSLSPMRLLYQTALERGVLIVNNTDAGLESDIGWLQPPDSQLRQFMKVADGVDFADLERRSRGVASRARRGDQLVVGGVFRMVPVKRPLFWLQTARAILDERPDARFILVGDGEMMPAVRTRTQELGLSDAVHLVGEQDAAEWFGAMDLLLHVAEREGSPNAIIEAQYLGVPVVALGVGGLGESVLDGRSAMLLSPDADYNAAGRAVAARAADRTWMEAARVEAVAHASATFSLRKLAASLETVLW